MKELLKNKMNDIFDGNINYMSENSGKGGGLGLSTMVFIVFLILKLCKVGMVANWSWLWVTSPLWIPIIVMFGIIVMVLILSFIVKIFDY
tara:strand:- start:293 stop:562 length:270 start_codon:yes stop_codon:yes gene_type:complete